MPEKVAHHGGQYHLEGHRGTIGWLVVHTHRFHLRWFSL